MPQKKLHPPLKAALFFSGIFISAAILVIVWARLPRAETIEWFPFLKPIPTASSSEPVTIPLTANTSTQVATSSSTEPEPSLPLGPMRAKPIGMICGERNVICVDESYQNRPLENPIHVTGTILTDEKNPIWWTLVENSSSSVQTQFLGDQFFVASSGTEPVMFDIRAFFTTTTVTSTGYLSFGQQASPSGHPAINGFSIPVRLPTKLTLLKKKIFYVPINRDETDCTEVRAQTIQIPFTLYPMEATLRALLEVEASSTPAGFITDIPERTKLISLSLVDGTAKAVFDRGLEQGMSLCRASTIRSQIEQTLKQFSGVKKVDILVEGESSQIKLKL